MLYSSLQKEKVHVEVQLEMAEMRKEREKGILVLVEQKIKEIQSLNESLSSALANIDGAHHLAGILTKDINKGLQNYIDDIIECKTREASLGLPILSPWPRREAPSRVWIKFWDRTAVGGLPRAPRQRKGGRKRQRARRSWR